VTLTLSDFLVLLMCYINTIYVRIVCDTVIYRLILKVFSNSPELIDHTHCPPYLIYVTALL